VAIGPLIGGLVTTYFSWRWVFVGEVVIVAAILVVARRIEDPLAVVPPPLDWLGAILSAAGLGLFVFGVLRSAEWGWVQPKADGPEWLGLSPTIWLMLAGIGVLWLFWQWELRLERVGRQPLVQTPMLQNVQLTGGLLMFFFQYLVQAGVFFIVPLFLSVVLELSALDTGVRLLPLSATLLLAALGVPRFFPTVSPRLVVRLGLLLMFAGAVVLLAGIDLDAGPEIVAIPMLLLGLGIGALASQLGAVTVSAVPDELSSEVGGLQNTMTNLGASLGTALAGSILIGTLTASIIQGIQENPDVPEQVKSQATVELAGGVQILSDSDLESALAEAGASPETADAVLEENREARSVGLRSALAVLAGAALIGLFFVRRIPDEQPKAGPAPTASDA
jgi:MFS family permease